MSRPDRSSAGRSRQVPYIYGEPAMGRHNRRRRAALEAEANVRRWCANRGVRLVISNEGHHWRFSTAEWVAEWWPSSAKLVFDKDWNRATHVHDSSQVLAKLQGRLGREAANDLPNA